MIVRVCPTCGLKFNVYPSARKTFCSNRCAAQHNNKLKPQNQPNRIVGICPVCSKTFSASPSHKRKFCSHSCANKVINLGRIAWNKGIPPLATVRQKISESNKGKERTLAFRQNQSRRLQGEHNPSKRPEVKRKISETHRHNIAVGKYNPSLWTQKKPTIPELRIINIAAKYRFPYRYVGNGTVILCGLNPDFINCNNDKKIIEIFGRVFHDPSKSFKKEVPLRAQEPYRKAIYASLGFDCLVLWDDEMAKLSDEEIADRIRKFTKAKHKPTAQLTMEV